MKTKIKRHYRSAISILLSVCMLISCMTVGLIATDAARVTEAEAAVGASEDLDASVGAIPSVVYFKPNSTWQGNGHYFKARWYQYNEAKGDATFTEIDSTNHIYMVNVSQNWYEQIQFERWGNSQSSAWDTDGREALPTDGKNYYIQNEQSGSGSWSNPGGTWSTYTPTITDPYLFYDDEQDPGKIKDNKVEASINGDIITATITGPFSGGTDIYTIMSANDNSNLSGALFSDDNSRTAKVASDSENLIRAYKSEWNNYNSMNLRYARASVKSGVTIQSLTVVVDTAAKTYTYSADPSVSTVTPAAEPAEAGTVMVNGSTNAATNLEYNTEVNLSATPGDDYEFSNWKSTTALEITNSNAASTTAKVKGTTNATAVFINKKFKAVPGEFEHGTLTVSPQNSWGSTVTPTVVPDDGYKVSKIYYSLDSDPATPVDGTATGFVMPKGDVHVFAEMVPCETYTVTFSATGNGTVKAKANGKTLTSPATVNEGTVVTFSAVAGDGSVFNSWGGDLSGSDTPKTLTINGNKTVTASFDSMVYKLVKFGSAETASATGTSYAMTKLDSGYYRYGKITSGGNGTGDYFTISKRLGSGTVYYAKSDASGTAWWLTTDKPAITTHEWSTDNTLSKTFHDNVGESGTKHYVFFDPETNKIWVSTDPNGATGIKIYAKDGVITDGNPGTGTTPKTTCAWGNSTLTVTIGSTTINGTAGYNSQLQSATLTQAQVEDPQATITVATTVESAKAGRYYVKAFDVNGVTMPVTSTSGSTYTTTFKIADLEANISNFIEITPIYFLKETDSSDPTTIRFYVNSFTGDIKSRWGGTLYCYSYDSSGKPNYGDWPGQPMINLGGGDYYIDLPKNTKAISLSNAAADWIHAKTLGVDLSRDATSDPTWENRNKYQCQSYDYDDFQYIYDKPGVGENDEDIVFDFKYKTGGNNFESCTGSNEQRFPSTITVSNYSGWEDYTDYYGELVDLWGTKILEKDKDKNPVHVVVQGYYDTSKANSSYYATTYVVYDPSGNKVAYSNSSEGYGKKSRSEFLQRSDSDMGLTSLAGIPVKITYEYAIYDSVSTINTKAGDNQFAERADGVWYYSESRAVKANIQIQYAENKHSAFSDDTYDDDSDAVPAVDYDGNHFKKNIGNVTNASAYFTDKNYGRSGRPTDAPLNMDYDNKIVEWAYTDGYDYYDITATESPDGEYTFLGWYKLVNDEASFITSSYTFHAEVVNGETFIARYVKTPAGQVKIAHKPVSNDSGGKGARGVEFDIFMTDDNNKTSILPAGTTKSANGSILVPKAYIKYGKGYSLKVKYSVNPDANSMKNGVYASETADATASTGTLVTPSKYVTHNKNITGINNFTIKQLPSTAQTEATVDTDTVEFEIPINSFFKLVEGTTDEYEFNSDFSVLELFSDFKQRKTSVSITKEVDVFSSETFAIKIENWVLADPEDPESGAYQNYTGQYTIVGEEGSPSYTIQNGTVNLEGDQTITLTDVPAGTQFRITELKLPAGSDYTSDDTTPVAISYTGTQGYSDPVILSATETIESGVTFTTLPDGNTNVTFKNNIKSRQLTLTKKLTEGTDTETSFIFNVQVNDANYSGDYTINSVAGSTSDGNISVHQDDVIVITGLTVGATVQVTETNIPFNYSYAKATLGTDDDTNVTTEGIQGYSYTVADDVNLKIWNSKIDFTYSLTYAYTSYRGLHNTQKYKVSGSLSAEDISTYFTVSDEVPDQSNSGAATTAYTFADDDKRALFLNTYGPYENNYMTKIKWNTALKSDTNSAGVDIKYYSASHQYIIDVNPISDEQKYVNFKLKLPYAHTSSWTTNWAPIPNSDGNVAYDSTQSVISIDNLDYMSWYATNGVKRYGTDAGDPVFVTAPEKVIDNGVTKYFRYWSVKTVPTEQNYSSVEYTKCYAREFNLAIFQDTIVEPIFTALSEYEISSGYTPNPHDEAQANASGATITYIENSRNQYNNNECGENMPNTRQKQGDRIYTDFLLSFANSDDTQYRTYADGTYTAGLLIERCAELNKDVSGNYFTESESDYQTAYGATLTEEQENTLKDYVKGVRSNTAQKADVGYGYQYQKVEFDANTLDNKNRIEYYFSMAVRSHTGEFVDNGAKNYVYRAYSYIKDSSGAVQLFSKPLYFTIYDMASIENAQAGLMYDGYITP